MQYEASEKKYSIFYTDNEASKKLGEALKPYIRKNTLFICIGTDKCIGDCLGPIVGTLLQRAEINYPVIGSLENPTHAVNLEAMVDKAMRKHPHHFTIAIDACIGYDDCVGMIQIKNEPVRPGKGIGKTLPDVGDISIVGIVDSIDNSDFFSIKNIRLNFIMKMAETISEGILYAIN